MDHDQGDRGLLEDRDLKDRVLGVRVRAVRVLEDHDPKDHGQEDRGREEDHVGEDHGCAREGDRGGMREVRSLSLRRVAGWVQAREYDRQY